MDLNGRFRQSDVGSRPRYAGKTSERQAEEAVCRFLGQIPGVFTVQKQPLLCIRAKYASPARSAVVTQMRRTNLRLGWIDEHKELAVAIVCLEGLGQTEVLGTLQACQTLGNSRFCHAVARSSLLNRLRFKMVPTFSCSEVAML